MTWMRRSISLLAIAAALMLTACPTSNGNGEDELPDIEELFPADNEVGSWVEDPADTFAGVEVARNYEEAWGMVNGDADSFEDGMSAFAREFYSDGTSILQLRVWEMNDEAGATSVYDALVIDDPLYTANTWEDASLGAAGRVADTGSHWWFNSRKNLYHVEAWIEPNDAAGKTEADSFLQAVLTKIP